MKKKDCACSGNSIVRSKGEYTIVVQRKTFNIPLPLPYCLWGSIYLNGKNFATPLQPYLPAGITVAVTILADGLRFRYSQGAKQDDIIVQGLQTNLVGYLEMLSNIKTNYLKTELVYFGVNAAINAPILADDQIKALQQTPLYLQRIGGLGSKDNETVIPLARKLPNNSVPNICELSMRHQDIKPENVWIHLFSDVFMVDTRPITLYWQIIINDIVNMNAETMSLHEIKENSRT